jgi:hypothetical protein
MSKTRNLSKVLALVIMLALVIGILPMGAMATNVDRTQRTFYDGTTQISTVTVSGSGVIVAGISDWTKSSATEASFVVSLSPNCTLTSVTVTIVPVSGTTGSDTLALDETKVITAGGIDYTVTVQKESAYVAKGSSVHNAYIGQVDGEGSSVTGPTAVTESGNTIYTYSAQAAATGYPYPVSLRIIPGWANYDETNYTVTVSSTSTATLTNFVGTYYLAYFASSGGILNFTVNDGTTTDHYRITFTSTGGAVGTADNAYAFLPAPGQYTNEGMGTGGWGDVYTSAGKLKNFSGSAVLTTGVSLGAFGGYLVYDFGTGGLDNSSTTPYGVDFIVYGNAFWNNSEPGCIQVGVLNADNTVAWYNIAGSLYYSSATTKNYAATYGNPNPSDTPSGTLASVPYTLDNWTNNGLVTKNPFHNHSWFPLDGNYFSSRTVSGQTALPIAKTTTLPFADYKTGQTYSYTDGGTHTQTNGQTLKFTGVCLNTASTMTKTQYYFFGYADVHPKGTSNPILTKPYNPYAMGAITNNNNVNEYNSVIGNCGGGDPIDISWAVDGSGNPVYLTNIQYVRIYTGTQQMNGAFGEISTEVCGVYAVSETGTGETTSVTGSSLSVTWNNGSNSVSGPALDSTITSTNTYGIPANTQVTVSYASSGNHIYVNENYGTGSASWQVTLGAGETAIVRVIVQDGTTTLPYIGYLKLRGVAEE